MIELVGYAGSALVAVSLMMSNIWRLRWINLVGAVFFVVYGLAVHAIPVALVNALIVAVDAYYLGLLSGKKDYFSLMPASGADESLLKGFVEYYQEDIQRFFPGFALRGIAEPRCVFTLRNLMPVGLFVCEKQGPQTLRILLDYVIPDYRDLRNARYLYSTQAGLFKEQGFREFRVQPRAPEFEAYVRKLGFAPVPGEPGSYAKPV
ncbi:MAG: hypothetical protein A2X36_16930 [Elusimicrobia bacterium GWA2_69_24]|nr:MAG: hypothetical protein A2X36_16930 [Elusimicrobia bacterium GWA2_69_24]HBL16116.1 hypothetical protein [Elusimicrobiota bacterium]